MNNSKLVIIGDSAFAEVAYEYFTHDSEYEVVGSSPGVFTHYYDVGGDVVAFNAGGEVSWMWKDFVNSTAMTRTAAGGRKVQRAT